MRERSAGSDGVLVEAVGSVVPGAIGIACPLIQIIGPALACDFLRLVTGVAVGLILRGPCQVVSEAGKCTLGAVGIAGGSTVTQRYRGTTGEVVPGVSGQVDRAGFLDRRWTVEHVIGAGDVERSLRPGEPGAGRNWLNIRAIRFCLLMLHRLRLTDFSIDLLFTVGGIIRPRSEM